MSTTTNKVSNRPNASSIAPARYGDDLYGWVEQQIALLRANEIGSIDTFHLTQELTDLGRGEFDKLVSAVRVVMHHMLKWDYQPERRSRSWALTIAEHRRRIIYEMKDSPSLKPRIGDALLAAYDDARGGAIKETRLPPTVFPESCPYDWNDVTQRSIPEDDTLPWE